MKSKLLLLVLLMLPLKVLAQVPLWHYSIQADVVAAPAGNMPFWLRSGQYGAIPPAGTSGALTGAIIRDYDSTKKQSAFNWGGALEVRGNGGSQSTLTLLQGYLKARKGIFEFTAGRTKDISGIVDTTLSSGAFSISGNALGIPKIQLSIPEYYSLPYFDHLFAFKGSFSFGLVGDLPVYNVLRPNVKNDTIRYIQNSLYLRLGRPDWRLQLFGGINHHVMYGNERRTFGLDLSPVSTFLYATVGKTYKGLSKVGNHLGSIDIALQYDFDNVQLLAYRQNLYDVGAIAHLANIADGINGISLTNQFAASDKVFNWHKVLLEFIYTKNQAGGVNSQIKSGDEDYYNNFEYTQGWTYYGVNLGNPLLTSREYTRSGQANDPNDYIIDNRIIALHIGFEGSINDTGILCKLTYSQNYGTYGTSSIGHSTGKIRALPIYGIYKEVKQFSGYFEANQKLNNGYSACIAVAGDMGALYYNSVGLQLKLKKAFN